MTMLFRSKRKREVIVRLDKQTIHPGMAVMVPGTITLFDWDPPSAGDELELGFEYTTHHTDHAAIEREVRWHFTEHGISVLALRLVRQ